MRWLVGSLMLLALSMSNIYVQEKTQSDVVFCNLNIPSDIKRANASFTITYAFEVGTEGKPVNIVKITDDYLSVEEVTPCLSEWRFQGIPKGSKLVASFRWRHGKGWDYLSVSGSQFSHKVKLQEEGYGYK
jgi:hypothetical protein